ncbi:mitochondrial escape protein 2 [Actinomortierella ambigua]|nr:mitochondrial escape protein 2 [Actinomortierella ambigua]
MLRAAHYARTAAHRQLSLSTAGHRVSIARHPQQQRTLNFLAPSSPAAAKSTSIAVTALPAKPVGFAKTAKAPHIKQSSKSYTYSTEAQKVNIATEEELPLQYGMLYFDNAYPLRMGWWDIRYSLLKPGWRSLERKAKNELVPPEEKMPFHFKIGGIEPRLKDGGMFVHFSYVRPSSYTTKEALKEIESRCEQHLIGHGHYMWFNFQKVRAFLVKGEPFLEDMNSRYPNNKIRVEFLGNLGVETLYTAFRKYGRIHDIITPPAVKDMPRQVFVQYTSSRAATSAKNCLHGAEIEGVKMNVQYEKVLKGNIVWTWLSNHPRISVPLGGAMVAGLSYLIFDPIRVFSMHAKITQLFNVNEYSVLRWIRKETIGRLSRAPQESLQAPGWREREEEEAKLRAWLRDPPETFIIVSGPRGAGKSEMVDFVVKEKHHKVILHCEELVNSRSDSEMLPKLAKQVGYIPLFQFMSNINNMIDMAITATTGQKAGKYITGLSATFEGQIKKILDTLTVAIIQSSPTSEMSSLSPEAIMKKIEATIEEKERRAAAKAASPESPEQFGKQSLLRKRKTKSKQHVEKSSWCDPDDIPVIVIDGFMCKEKGAHAKELWTLLAEWAAVLVENHLAHVVFVTNNVTASKPLAKALPNRTFESVILADATLESAMEFVHKHLDQSEFPTLKKSVETIGGRLTDLELFVQKVKSGMAPEEATHDILGRAVIEVRKAAFDYDNTEGKTAHWTAIQFWAIMQQLAFADSANYDELKIHPLFKNDESPFGHMEEAELISIVHKNGRPFLVKPGKPIYRAAFRELLSDSGFAAVMSLDTMTFLEKVEQANVNKYEAELKELSSLLHQDGSWIFGGGRVPKEIDTRVKWLMKKLAASHDKIAGYEQEISKAKLVVASVGQSL